MPAVASKPWLARLLAAAVPAWAATNGTAANGDMCCYSGCSIKPTGCNPEGTYCSQSSDHCTNNCHGEWCPGGGPGPTPPPPPPTPPSPGAEWCLSADDLGWDYNAGGGQLIDSGFTIKGGARAHSKAAFNLLGGFIEFDLDTTAAHVGLNNNVYFISPHLGPEGYTSMDQYCDGAVQHGMRAANRSANDYWCMELDINEDNGNCGSQTAVHTVMGHPGGCDANGCTITTHWNQQRFKVRAEITEDGSFQVNMGGIQQNPNQDEGSKGIVRDTMKSRGAVIQASQWANPGGWLPVAECGAGGDLDSSVYTVSNIRIKGSVVAGPTPRKCGPAPAPPTPPTPPSPPAADEWCLSADDLGWDYNAGGGQLIDSGFTIKGGARAHSKAAYDLLGGFIEFDLDTTNAHVGLNNNVYFISPHLGPEGYTSMDQYCDGAVQHGRRAANRSANDYWCMELDINEDNGNCGSQTAVHTVMGHPGGCDANGCTITTHWNQQRFKVRAEITEDGSFQVNMGGIQQNPNQDEGSKAIVRDTMKSRGAVIQASQWANPGGWLPVGECGSDGDLDSSVYTVSNIRIKGRVVAGPTPRKCGQSEAVVIV